MTRLARLLELNQSAFEDIKTHPFNQKLFNGTLPRLVFQKFMVQDKLYLADFANVLRIIADRLENPSYKKQFTELQKDTIAYEQSMLSSSAFSFWLPTQKTQALQDYTRHLLDTARRAPLPVTIASVLPCFWIYCELLGKNIAQPIPTDHPYRNWLITYTDPLYTDATAKLMSTFEAITKDIQDPALIAQIEAAFARSVQCEYDFFDTCCPQKKKRENTLGMLNA